MDSSGRGALAAARDEVAAITGGEAVLSGRGTAPMPLSTSWAMARANLISVGRPCHPATYHAPVFVLTPRPPTDHHERQHDFPLPSPAASRKRWQVRRRPPMVRTSGWVAGWRPSPRPRL